MLENSIKKITGGALTPGFAVSLTGCAAKEFHEVAPAQTVLLGHILIVRR